MGYAAAVCAALVASLVAWPAFAQDLPDLGREAPPPMISAVEPQPASQFGLAAFQGESAMVVRPFRDDRMRVKAIGGVGMQLFFDQAVGGLSAYLGAGFEMPL